MRSQSRSKSIITLLGPNHPSQAPEPFNVLVANDDEYQLWFLEELFQSNKFKVWRAINGQEAFFKAQEIKAKNINLDLVVLDLNMPISNGYEACEKIVKLFKSEERKAKEVV